MPRLLLEKNMSNTKWAPDRRYVCGLNVQPLDDRLIGSYVHCAVSPPERKGKDDYYDCVVGDRVDRIPGFTYILVCLRNAVWWVDQYEKLLHTQSDYSLEQLRERKLDLFCSVIGGWEEEKFGLFTVGRLRELLQTHGFEWIAVEVEQFLYRHAKFKKENNNV